MSFINKNLSDAKNVVYSITMIAMVLVAASWGGHSINSKAINPSPDTVFYRIDTSIRKLENQLWRQGLQFIREKKRRLRKMRCYIVVDETYDSYTGKLFKKEKKAKGRLTVKEKQNLKYIHKFRKKKGDTGSYKYLGIAIVYGNKRRMLRIKAIKKEESYHDFIIKTLVELKKEIDYECALFDRGFYEGEFIDKLQKNGIPFIVRARVCKKMREIFGFFYKWKCHRDYPISKYKIKGDLVLGLDKTKGKGTKWAFITNLEFKNWYKVREIYRKRWNIENIFKATDGIQLRAQTSDPTIRLFCVCLSFLFYNAWQNKNKRREITLLGFIMESLEWLFKIVRETAEYYKSKLKINLPFWDRVISSA